MVDFESNTGLVFKVYNDHFSQYSRLQEDLVQEGMIGLWKACQTFDEGRGTPFSTYACVCIRNAMGMFIRKELRHQSVASIDEVFPNEQDGFTLLDLLRDESMLKSDDLLLAQAAMNEAKKLPCYGMIMMKVSGMKQRQIAKLLGMTEVAVSETLRSAFQELRDKLK